MLLKTKERCGKSGWEAGMCLKTKEIRSKSGNVVEKKGHRWQIGGFQLSGVRFSDFAAEAIVNDGLY